MLLPAAFHETRNEKINQPATDSDCVNIKLSERESPREGMKRMLFYVSQKAACVLELIKT